MASLRTTQPVPIDQDNNDDSCGPLSAARSTATSALQNLPDNSTPLQKKRSWMNVGGTFRKGALRIKGAIDYVRGEQPSPQNEETRQYPETPKRPQTERRRSTFSPKHATASLRKHLPRQTKTASVHSIFPVPAHESIDLLAAAGPKCFTTDEEQQAGTHARRISVASSLAGSIRGFGRNISMKRPAVPQADQSPERPVAAAIPLPSSPINIPNAPPALLSLNLGGLFSPTFGTPNDDDSPEPDLKNGLRTGEPEMCLALVEPTLDETQCLRDGLSTPMPGTSLPLELDGSSEKPRGNVSGSNDSMEALARAASVAHAADEAESIDCLIAQNPGECSPPPAIRPAPLVIPSKAKYRDITSSTVKTCPSDMQALSRQLTPMHEIDHGDIQRWQQRSRGPSLSSVRDGTTEQQQHETIDGDDSAVDLAAMASPWPPLPMRRTPSPQLDENGAVDSPIQAPQTPVMKLPCQFVDGAVLSDDAASIITNYDEFKTQQIFCPVEEEELNFPDYNNVGGEASPDGSPSSVAPLMTRLYEAATHSSQNSSPTSGVPRAADVGSVFWKFSANNWLGGSGAGATEDSINDDSDESTEMDICPTSPSAVPFMGDPLDFERHRSDRDARYNALQTGVAGHVAEDSKQYEFATLRFSLQDPITEVDLPLPKSYDNPLQQSASVSAQYDSTNVDNTGAASASNKAEGTAVQALQDALRDYYRAEAILGYEFKSRSEASAEDDTRPASGNLIPDGVQTSSPTHLTEWERQTLQSAIPSQAHENTDNASTRKVSYHPPTQSKDASEQPRQDSVSTFVDERPKIILKLRRKKTEPITLPFRPATRNDCSPERVAAGEPVLPAALSSSPTGGIETGGFSPTASPRELQKPLRTTQPDVKLASLPGCNPQVRWVGRWWLCVGCWDVPGGQVEASRRFQCHEFACFRIRGRFE
ncbi:hypothetical protein LTR56_013267 [Elasticomyces elasticus]|nr:hypothetical protein LTR56_013267 [Elasticomyces elasticus]KAK3668401.1 hypothetical protein LTR22_000693 [Elasticomyces elasticus]KAK4930909.1 hypothetical protein LTR49_002675 [Elasticomyces elasticus]KAK5758679.1 hypothetical protein LTS12_011225 [Elasticomyces elasticus]